MQFGLVVRCRRQQVPPEVHLLVSIAAMIHLLLQFLSIRQQAVPAVKLDIILCEHPHGFDHLAMRLEVEEEPALGVDEVDEVVRGDVLEGDLGLEDEAVEEVDLGWRHLRRVQCCVNIIGGWEYHQFSFLA